MKGGVKVHKKKPCPKCGKPISIHAVLCHDCGVDARSGALTSEFRYNKAYTDACEGFFDEPRASYHHDNRLEPAWAGDTLDN